MKSIIKEFGDHYEAKITAELIDTQEREDQLRVSGFPYCGLRHAYKMLTKHEVVKKRNFGSQFYTGVGTITHEAIQEFMGHGGKIYGQWKCLDANCSGKRLFSRKNTCPVCKKFMQYEEFTVKAFRNVSGHLDGVYKSKSGEYWVIDYKTSSIRVINSQSKNKTLPYHHNVCQIRAYCSLIELVFDIKISGWMLHYIARDDPMHTFKVEGARVTTESKALELERIRVYDRQFSMVKRMKTRDHLGMIAAEKPCASYEDYKRDFDYFDPCPLSRGGVCFDNKKRNEILDFVWNDRVILKGSST